MDLISADQYYENFKAAAATVSANIEICRSIPGRDQVELAEIAAELERSEAKATGRDLAF
jgi:hypothetical protein